MLLWNQGGAIAYAAAVASAYGTRACVVTAAGPDADLAVFKGHELHVVPTNSTLTFEHSYTWWGEDLYRHLHSSAAHAAIKLLLPIYLPQVRADIEPSGFWTAV